MTFTGLDDLRQRVIDRGYELTKIGADTLVDQLLDAAGTELTAQQVLLEAPSFDDPTWTELLTVEASTTWQWAYGAPTDRGQPFDPHIDLDGLEFDRFNFADILAKDPGDFPEGNTFWFPQDHDGCQCLATPVVGSDPFEPNGTDGSSTSISVGGRTVTVSSPGAAGFDVVPAWWAEIMTDDNWAAALGRSQ